MSRMFIAVKNGQPFEHPIVEENFRNAFPSLDPDNLPPEFAIFERVAKPQVVYEVVEGSSYGWVGGVVKDVWRVRAMTAEEKANKIAVEKASQPFSSWLFNEDFCRWDPPVPMPDDGKFYLWIEQAQQWVVAE
jgi:hypothetical protein